MLQQVKILRGFWRRRGDGQQLAGRVVPAQTLGDRVAEYPLQPSADLLRDDVGVPGFDAGLHPSAVLPGYLIDLQVAQRWQDVLVEVGAHLVQGRRGRPSRVSCSYQISAAVRNRFCLALAAVAFWPTGSMP